MSCDLRKRFAFAARPGKAGPCRDLRKRFAFAARPGKAGPCRASWLAMLCVVHGSALASPRTDPTMGRAVFTGATSPNPTSLQLNPAALGVPPISDELGVPSELYIAAMGTYDTYSIQRRDLDINTGTVSDAERSSPGTMSPGGTFAVIYHTGSEGQLTLAASFRSSPAERFIGGVDSLRYHSLGGEHRVWEATVGVGVRATSGLYFGVSIASQNSYLKLRYARDTALEAGRDPKRGIDSDCGGAPCGVENPLATELYAVDVRPGMVSASNFAFNIGGVAELAQGVWFGLALHLPPGLALQSELSGTMQVDRAPRDGGGILRGGATVYVSQPASLDGEFRVRLPAALDLHVGGRYEWLSRLSQYDVRSYGFFFPGAGVPEWMPRARGLDNTFASWAGVEQADTGERVRVGGRIGFETSAIPDNHTSALTVAPFSYTADAGAQLRLSDTVVLQATYGLQYFPTVNVTDSVFDPRVQLACYDSEHDYATSACDAVRHGYGLPTADGSYSRIEHAARLALRVVLE